MNSRERVFSAIYLEEPDKVPIDEEIYGPVSFGLSGSNKPYVEQLIIIRKEKLD